MTSYLVPRASSDSDYVIGQGGWSSVTLARDPRTNRSFAVKHMSASHEQFYLLQEVETLAKLNHPCIVRIYGWVLPEGHRTAEIHMEYAENKSLKDALHTLNRGDIPTFWNPTGIGIIICGLVLGMRFVHSRGIIHRDLKPSNILLGRKGRALVADFGTSQSVYEDRTPVEATIHYAAPELFEDGAQITTKCDVFTFGLVLYEILARKPVFDCEWDPPFAVIRRLRARDLPAIPSGWGELMADLIPSCWNGDPAERPSFDEIFCSFERSAFEIVPEGNAKEIRDYCQAVLAWEERNPFSA
jgi:serine/threonine protein kinase